jgi:tetratricopeptide (TPR) repeat protein
VQPEGLRPCHASENWRWRFQRQGKLEKTEDLCRKNPANVKKLESEETWALVKSTHNLANALRATGKLDDAQKMYKEALETSNRGLGIGSTETMFIVNDLARLLDERKRTQDVALLWQQVVEICVIYWEKESPLTCHCTEKLALAWWEHDQKDQTLDTMKSCAAISQQILRPDHTKRRTHRRRGKCPRTTTPGESETNVQFDSPKH